MYLSLSEVCFRARLTSPDVQGTDLGLGLFWQSEISNRSLSIRGLLYLAAAAAIKGCGAAPNFGTTPGLQRLHHQTRNLISRAAPRFGTGAPGRRRQTLCPNLGDPCMPIVVVFRAYARGLVRQQLNRAGKGVAADWTHAVTMLGALNHTPTQTTNLKERVST
jgi:hypothetical protein